MSTEQDYWEECVACSLDEQGIAATPEQITAIAKDIQTSIECKSMAFHVPENPYETEKKELMRELEKHRNKTICPECKGKGWVGEYDASIGRSWSGTCGECNGHGFKYPKVRI